MMLQPERRTFESARGAFSYLEWDYAGADAPILHFAHANGMNAFTYRRLLAPLADRLHIYAIDQRGHGMTPAQADIDKHKSWGMYRDDLECFIESFGAPTVLGGHSLGAVASMKLAAKRPDLVNALIMCDPVMFPPGFLFFWQTLKRVGLGSRISIASRAVKRRKVWPDRETMLQAYRGRGAFKSWQVEWIEDYIEGGTRERDDGQVELTCDPAWESRNFSTLPASVWKVLAQVRVPVCLIYGENSNTFLSKSAAHFRKVLPDAKMKKVNGATHFVVMEHPDLIRRRLMGMCFREKSVR